MTEPIERYYKMKQNYDKKYISYKNTILNSDLAKNKKKKKIKAYKHSCSNCKRKVGMIFNNKNKKLSIRCGDSINPCELEYVVEKGSSGYIPELIVFFYNKLEIIKTDIIKIKLSLLFSIESEENISEIFSKLKDEYKQTLNILDNLEHYIFEDEKVTYQYMGKEVKTSREEAIKHYNEILSKIINDYKFDMDSFDGEDDYKINDAIDKYKTRILPVTKEIQAKLFDIVKIIDDDDKKRLVKLVLSPEKYDVDYTKSKILIDKK